MLGGSRKDRRPAGSNEEEEEVLSDPGKLPQALSPPSPGAALSPAKGQARVPSSSPAARWHRPATGGGACSPGSERRPAERARREGACRSVT